VHLGDTLRSLALDVSDIELKLSARNGMLDAMMDLHNDLNGWAVNTEHDQAAEEVMAIVDQYLARVQQLGLTTTQQPN
jgi:hypothetical protein